MREEIAAAVVFLTRIVKKNDHLSPEQVQEFSDKLSTSLVEKFKNHWYQDNPLRGQGYRCIRVNETDPIDAILDQAAQDVGLTYRDLHMPQEMTIWVDPREVCCRLGEINGMYCTLASFRESGEATNQAEQIDIDNLLERHQQRKVTNYAYNFRSNYRPPPQINNNIPPQQYYPQQYQEHRQTSPTWHNNLYNQVLESNHANQSAQWHKNVPSNNINRGHPKQQVPQQDSPNKGDKYRWVRGADLIRA